MTQRLKSHLNKKSSSKDHAVKLKVRKRRKTIERIAIMRSKTRTMRI